MKRIIISAVFLALSISSYSQPFWTEDFGFGNCLQSNYASFYTGESGQWEMTETGLNDPQSNVWYVGPKLLGGAVGECAESCGFSGENENSTLHLSPDPIGDIGAAYLETGFGFTDSDIRVESPVINCSGRENIEMNFLYFAGGVPGSDESSVEYFDGTSWTELMVLTPTSETCGVGVGLWTNFSVILPASANNNPNVRIGFRWINVDDGVSTDPSVAIDNIALSGDDVSNEISADFLATETTICMGECISFSDLSVGTGIDNWSWEFPGSETTSSIVQNPGGICYLNEGSYDVTLEVGNGVDFDSITLSGYISVEDCTPSPPIEIGASSDNLEVGSCINFEDFSDAPIGSEWNWTFEGGTPNTAVEKDPAFICYNSPGTFDVSLSITLENETIDSTFIDFITVFEVSSVNDNLSHLIVISPNPTRDLATIRLPQGEWTISLLNPKGQVLQIYEKVTSTQFQLDLQELPQGVYFVRVNSGSGKAVKKLVVQ